MIDGVSDTSRRSDGGGVNGEEVRGRSALRYDRMEGGGSDERGMIESEELKILVWFRGEKMTARRPAPGETRQS